MRHALKPILVGSLALLSSCSAGRAVQASAPEAAGIETALEACAADQAEKGDFSGVIFLDRAGSSPLSRAWGTADGSAGRLNTVDTPFNIGSMNKMFTAVAVGRLVDAGKMAFDAPVGHYLPDLPPKVGRITLAQLLSHTGGLGEYLMPTNRPRIAAARKASDLIPLVIEAGISFEPGERRAYSNSGFVLLGAAVEAVSGRTYSDFVRTQILSRAKMSSTSFEVAPRHAARRLTRMTMEGPQPGAPRRPYDEMGAWASPAGGAYSTARDLARFADAMRRDKLVSPRTKAELWTLRAPNQAEPAGAQMRYGYGFGVSDTSGTDVVGHNGGGPGVNAEGWWTTAPGWTLVILSNFDPPAASLLARAARMMLNGEAPPEGACAAARSEMSRARRTPAG